MARKTVLYSLFITTAPFGHRCCLGLLFLNHVSCKLLDVDVRLDIGN